MGIGVALLVIGISSLWQMYRETEQIKTEIIEQLNHRFEAIRTQWQQSNHQKLYVMLSQQADSPHLQHYLHATTDAEKRHFAEAIDAAFTFLHQYNHAIDSLHFFNSQGDEAATYYDHQRNPAHHALLRADQPYASEDLKRHYANMHDMFQALQALPPYQMQVMVFYHNLANEEPIMLVGFSVRDDMTGQFGGVLFAQIKFNTYLTPLQQSIEPEQTLLIKTHNNEVLLGKEPETENDSILTAWIFNNQELSKHTWLSIADTPIVTLSIQLNFPVINQRLMHVIWASLFAFLLALIPALIFILIQSRKISGPIRQLTEGAEALAHGQLKHRIPYLGDDEIGFLGENINHAIESIQNSQKALINNFQYIENITNTMTEPLFVIDNQGLITKCNPALCSLISMPSRKMVGKSFLTLFPTTLAQNNPSHIQSMTPETIAHIQRYIEAHPHALAHFFLNTPVPIILIDALGHIIDSNNAMSAQTGWSPNEHRKKNISSLIPQKLAIEQIRFMLQFHKEPHLTEQFSNRIFPVLRHNQQPIDMIGLSIPLVIDEKKQMLIILQPNKHPHHWDLFNLTQLGRLLYQCPLENQHALYCQSKITPVNGHAIPLEIFGALLQDQQQVIEGAVLVVRDLRMQLELENSRQIEIEMRAKESAMIAKDEFMATMSHELRTPLTTLLGHSDLLSDTALTYEQSHILNTMRNSGKTLLYLINDILDISKIEAGKFEIEHIPFAFNSMIHDIVAMFSQRAEQKGLQLIVNSEPKFDHYLLGDEMRIRQILMNLLSNAIKFTQHGNVRLTISHDHQNNLLHFKVKDQGIGMSEETLENLFQPFKQADQSISRKFGGTGLGLYISQKLANLMHGDIQVISEEGRGSTFSLIIPVHLSDKPFITQTVTPTKASPTQIPLNAAVHSMTGHILLAEDTEDIQTLMQIFLKKLGITSSIAGNGRIAFEMASNENFDLILMDMQMPEMDGIEATRKLRASGCNTPIIAMTANVMQKHKDLFSQAGCNDFLAKPIDRKQLNEILQTYLPASDAAPSST
ncbi:MAG: response regulator [Zetaproteobacteria bacterium]|nr:response regulator [Zetaproteobacteria bacterium]